MKQFLSQLRIWSFHCSLNALPSLLIALTYLKFYQYPIAIAAMLLAIFTFILSYSAFICCFEPFITKGHVLHRALRAGLKIRSIISIISLATALNVPGLMLSPDFWCGLIATAVYRTCQARLGLLSLGLDGSGGPGFLAVYSVTILEGLILSGFLFIFSLFSVLVIQSKERRKLYLQETAR